MHRRDVLRASGLAALASAAGCTGLADSGGSGEAPDEESGSDGGTGTQFDPGDYDHASTTDLADQPTLGDGGRHLLVAFEDPSCPTCKRFEETTVPKIRSNLVETGKARYAFRGYPVVYPWGEPAAHALEATFDRDADAFWALVDYYFETQGDLNGDNVLNWTEGFLADETTVDSEAVVSDVREGAYADAVQADLDAGEAAGAQATPTVFLFRDGEYLTKASGNVSYDVIATALGE